MSLDKVVLKDELLAHMTRELESMERAHQETKKGATHEEAKPENDKDTRALEQSYLARGQAARVAELRTDLAEVRNMPLRAFGEDDPIAVGALVTAEDESGAQTFFMAPKGGGAILSGEVRVVTPKSPIGAALLQKRTGDDVSLTLAGRTRELSIVHVR